MHWFFFGKMAPVANRIGWIYLWFVAMDNYLLHESGHSPADKIEERFNFSLSHTSLYLAESDDEQDDNSAAANTFYIFCVGGGYISSLSAIIFYVFSNSDVVRCWIFTSDLFLPNDPLPSDDMVDWDNYSMLGIGGRDINIDEDLFVLHNSW